MMMMFLNLTAIDNAERVQKSYSERAVAVLCCVAVVESVICEFCNRVFMEHGLAKYILCVISSKTKILTAAFTQFRY